jgi:hypothetical protein
MLIFNDFNTNAVPIARNSVFGCKSGVFAVRWASRDHFCSLIG